MGEQFKATLKITKQCFTSIEIQFAFGVTKRATHMMGLGPDRVETIAHDIRGVKAKFLA
jgi:hypothetical protein